MESIHDILKKLDHGKILPLKNTSGIIDVAADGTVSIEGKGKDLKTSNQFNVIKSQLSLVSVNLEKMPLYFFGSSKEREKLEVEIKSSGKPHTLLDVFQDGKGYKLSFSPSSVYGLLTGFDQDVLAAIQYKIYEQTKADGICPKRIRISLLEFPKIMRLNKSGVLYERVRESIKRLSETTVYHENFVKVRKSSAERLEVFQETALKLIDYKGFQKEELKKGGNPAWQKQFIDVEIPDWLQNDINTNYTTAFDPDIYFSLPGDRPRRLYRFLELIRYEQVRTVSYDKILAELTLMNVKTNTNRNIKRAIDPLIECKYLKSYQLTDQNIVFVFTDVKRKHFPSRVTQELSVPQLDLLSRMKALLGDQSGDESFRRIALNVPGQIIEICLSQTKDISLSGKVRTNKAAVFTDLIKRECAQKNIKPWTKE